MERRRPRAFVAGQDCHLPVGERFEGRRPAGSVAVLDGDHAAGGAVPSHHDRQGAPIGDGIDALPQSLGE
ncbi:hypothetical protein DJ71_16290, partial [Halorubrum sp. E3]